VLGNRPVIRPDGVRCARTVSFTSSTLHAGVVGSPIHLRTGTELPSLIHIAAFQAKIGALRQPSRPWSLREMSTRPVDAGRSSLGPVAGVDDSAVLGHNQPAPAGLAPGRALLDRLAMSFGRCPSQWQAHAYFLQDGPQSTVSFAAGMYS